MIAGQQHHSGRQGLPQRGDHAHGPIASLVKAGPGGVQIELCHVVHNKQADGILCPGLRKLLQPVGPAQPIPHGGLYHSGAPLLGGKLGIHAPAPDGKGPLPGNEFLPG